MMHYRKSSLFGIAITLLWSGSHGASAAVVDFTVAGNISGNTAVGTSAHTTGVGTTTLTSSTGFSTGTAYIDSSAVNYEGPAQYGGAYVQVTYENVQGGGDPDTWFWVRTFGGITSRRNGANPSVSGTARIGTLFELDELSMIDSSSTISMNPEVTGSPATINAYLFVENGGVLYRSTPATGMNGSTQNFSGLDALVFQPVTVDGTTLALTDAGSTVLGSALSSITKIGVFMEFVSPSGGGSQEIRLTSYQANLSAVPEPASLALAACGGLMILGRRRRAETA